MSWTSLVKTLSGLLLPRDTDDYVPVRVLPQQKSRFGFSRTVTNGVSDTLGAVIPPLGPGQTVAQVNGNLVLTAGTTANADTLIRSNFTLRDAFTLRWSTVLSQRIANNQLIIELVDIFGDGLATTILSATSVRVTVPNHPFTAPDSVGQTVTLGNYAGTGNIPTNTQAVIASISGDQITFTVSGCTTGTGTCSVFGWNYHRFMYDGTSATVIKYRGQRNGYPGTEVSASMSTTSGVGHIAIYNFEDGIAALSDQLRASTTGLSNTVRASAVQDIPDDNTELYLQIRMANGTTAPASNTTWTIAFIDYEMYAPQQVSVTSSRPQAPMSPQPVTVISSTTLSASTAPGNSTSYNLVTTASTNTAMIVTSGTSRKLYELTISNPTPTPAYVKIYGKNAAPTLASDTPVMTIPAPPNSFTPISFPPNGKMMAAGIAIAVTAGAAPNDTANAPAGIQIGASYI